MRRDAPSPQIRASGGGKGAPKGADDPGEAGRWQRCMAVSKKLTQEKEVARRHRSTSSGPVTGREGPRKRSFGGPAGAVVGKGDE